MNVPRHGRFAKWKEDPGWTFYIQAYVDAFLSASFICEVQLKRKKCLKCIALDLNNYASG